MRVTQLASDFLDWRWAPCVGLTAGSLAFVALALLFIPTQIDGAPTTGEALSTLDRPSPPRPQRALFGASLSREAASIGRRVTDSEPSRTSEQAVPQQRGFTPVAEREAYVPPPAPEPPPAPPPEPGTTIIIQPEPGGPSREVTVQ